MLKILLKILTLFNKREKKTILILFLNSLFIGLIDVIGIASIMPFVAVLTNPDLIEAHYLFSYTYDLFGFESHRAYIIALGLLCMVLLITSHAMEVFDSWLNVKFVNIKEYGLSRQLLSSYLLNDFEKTNCRNTSELGKNILEDVENVISGILFSGMGAIGSVISSVLIILFLLWIDPLATLTVTVIFSLCYSLIYLFLKTKLQILGGEIKSLYAQMFIHTQQALDGLKEIKAFNKEDYFIRKYSAPRKASALNNIRYTTMELFPKHLLEVVAFGTVIAISLYFVLYDTGSQWGYSFIAIYVISAYRIIPMVKNVFDCLENVTYYQAFLDGIWNDLNRVKNMAQSDSNQKKYDRIETIELKKINYCYDSQPDIAALNNINLKLKAGERVCFIGASGAGKTTLIDVLLGLLIPEIGSVFVNDQEVSESKYKELRQCIGYVPQDPYLLDDTLENNILFGRSIDSTDSLHRAFETACLSDVFEVSADKALNLPIGQYGGRLSGGQKQRIAIARALLKEPDILIMDESTDGLDLVTEQQLLGNMSNSKNMTLLFASHRPSVMKFCERIVVMEKGKIVMSATYEQLANHEKYNSLVK